MGAAGSRCDTHVHATRAGMMLEAELKSFSALPPEFAFAPLNPALSAERDRSAIREHSFFFVNHE
jgi:hypothetical protein